MVFPQDHNSFNRVIMRFFTSQLKAVFEHHHVYDDMTYGYHYSHLVKERDNPAKMTNLELAFTFGTHEVDLLSLGWKTLLSAFIIRYLTNNFFNKEDLLLALNDLTYWTPVFLFFTQADTTNINSVLETDHRSVC